MPIKFLLGDIDYDIKTYGYSVVMIHPHNFAIQVNGSLTDVVDYDRFKLLTSIVSAGLDKKNLRVMSIVWNCRNRIILVKLVILINWVKKLLVTVIVIFFVSLVNVKFDRVIEE